MSNHTAEQPKSGADALREMQELKRELETIQADAITEDGEISPKELERTLRSAILRQQGTIPTNPEDMSAAERAAAVMDRAGRLQSLDFRAIQPETFEGIEALDIQKITDSMLECFEQTAAAAIELVNKIAESWESDQERLAKSLQQIADVLKQREDYKTALQPFLAAELEKAAAQHTELETVTAELLAEHFDLTPADAAELAELSDGFRADGETDAFLLNLPLCAQIIDAAKAAYIASGGSVGELSLDDPPDMPRYVDKKRRYFLIEKPENFAFPLDNVNHKAFEGLLMGFDKSTGKPHKVTMKAAGKQKSGVYVYVSMSSFDGLNPSEPLDIDDNALLNMIYSYLENSPEMSLCRVLESFGQPRPTEKQLSDAYRRLQKLRNTDITIDCKEWAKLKKRKTYSIYKRRILDGFSFEEIRNERTGALVDVFMRCAIPVNELPLYQFADMSDQLTHLPMKSAMITGDNSITAKTAAIRHILLERIVRKHRSDKSGKITLLSAIYEKIGAETRTEKNRARDQVKKFLLEWVKNGTLYGFAFRKSGNTFDAIVIARNKSEMDEAKTENPTLDGWFSR